MHKKIAELLIDRANDSIPEEMKERIERIPVNAVSDSGYDEFGFNPEHLKVVANVSDFFYHKWFRTEAYGVANIPEEGPGLIIANHSGQIPLDGMMIAITCMLEMDRPRIARAMVEKWFPTLPHVSILFARFGQVPGIMENAEKLLGNGELVMIFPEGIRGSGKTWDKRYQLQRFTPGFMELSIRFDAPIIPTAVIGGEEQAPSFYDVKELAKLIGFPYFPLTPTFPWLGPLGLMPLPSKYHIVFGEQMDFSSYEDDLPHPRKVKNHVEKVRETIQEMVNQGLEYRVLPGF